MRRVSFESAQFETTGLMYFHQVLHWSQKSSVHHPLLKHQDFDLLRTPVPFRLQPYSFLQMYSLYQTARRYPTQNDLCITKAPCIGHGFQNMSYHQMSLIKNINAVRIMLLDSGMEMPTYQVLMQ